MGNLGDLIPPGDDTEIRAQRDLERRQQEESAARRLARSQIGDGGVLRVDGTLEVTGDLQVPAGSLSSAGTMSAGTNVTAGQDVVATRDVTAGRDVAAVGQVRGDNGLFPGGINSVDVYLRLVTGSGSFRTTSANVLGQLGQTVSSRRYKQDIETARIPREALRSLHLVLFRYIASVPFDQEQQPVLLGLIAEEVFAIEELEFLVILNDAGQPEALQDFALPFLGLLLAQYTADDLDEARRENSALKNELGELSAKVLEIEKRIA